MRASRPTILFDGDCGFCRRWIERWRATLGERVEFVTMQELGERFPGIPREDLRRALHLVETDGQVYRGAEAIFRALAVTRAARLRLWIYEHVPGAAAVIWSTDGQVVVGTSGALFESAAA